MPRPSEPPRSGVAVRKAATFGPEHAVDVGGRSWCWWDVWFALIAVVDHNNDLGVVRDGYAARIGALQGGRAAEARWAHVVDLIDRLDTTAVTVGDVAAPFLADKRVFGRARDKTTSGAL